jgi:hypothetical protein
MTIQTVDFSFNPLALSTTEKAWNKPESSLSTRIYQAASSLVYDIYLKNPYDITIGNCSKLMNAKEPQSTLTKVGVSAAAVFGSLYTLMLYGATIHILGSSLAALGSRTGYNAIIKAAEATKAVGKNLFVSGAVPIYGVFYALPKHAILALPIYARAAADKIAFAANWTFQNVISPVWDQVVCPALKVLGKQLSYLAKEIGHALSVIAKTVATSAQYVFKNIIVPAWKEVVLPGLKFTGKAIHSAITTIVNSLHILAQETAKAASIVFQKAIVPAFNVLNELMVKAGNYLAAHVIKPLGMVLADIAGKVGQASQAVFDAVVVPIIEVVASSANALGNAVIDVKQQVWLVVNEVAARSRALFGV